MGLTIELRRQTSDRAEASVADERLGEFDPSALRVGDAVAAPRDAEGYGRLLWRALGGEALAERLARLPLAPDPDGWVALETDDAELAAIPWEFVHNGTSFVVLDHLFVRRVPVARPPQLSVNLGGVLRLVAHGAAPLLAETRDPQGALQVSPVSQLGLEEELGRLYGGLLKRRPAVGVRWHRVGPTLGALSGLGTEEVILYHYSGHGTVQDGQAWLCLDDGTGRMTLTSAQSIARKLRGRTLFAFLNACRTADSTEPGANLALALVKAGIPVVLGTQYSIPDKLATEFAVVFYAHLASGEAPALALYRAREALVDRYPDEPQKWMIPALYEARGFEWPALQAAEIPPEPVPETRLMLERLRAPDAMLGRARELVELSALYMRNGRKVVTVRGAGGIGKTTLVRALSKRLRFHFTDGVYAVSLTLQGETTLSAATVRHELADTLAIARHPDFVQADATGQEIHWPDAEQAYEQPVELGNPDVWVIRVGEGGLKLVQGRLDCANDLHVRNSWLASSR